ncbi:T9SS type A sorting domain-containing protein [Flavobacterium sp. NRK F10]|uniref:T9SS type A sorting domain-containing protein n=1 Tax=Flavobacterium sp. NRK F10 TaxID=2954931 RepID=UPI002091C315|nr:T9SS type A sorting domain-containing protein [Flavobacterium sp. NRK F10]MCO6173637.1 T9SS type A sorting domain-containing protein [Flavobacterium sp. NRK F10]
MKKILLLALSLFVFSLKAQTVVYVDTDATGNNDGTSWANAYNSLHDALTNTNIAGAEIWVAEGTYKPINASTPFLNQYGVNIFGGFVGTENTKADRNVDPWLHPVYLSGDINGDDLNEVPSASSANKSDNATRILQIEPTTLGGATLNHVNESIVIDRINFVKAYGGSALYSHPSSANYTQNEITLINCRFSRNYASTRPAFDIWANIFGGSSSSPIKTFSLLNSIVDENVSQVGYAFEYRTLQDDDEIFIANNLFIANKVENAGYSGSVARLISVNYHTLKVRFSNNTLALNQEGNGVTGGSVASCIRLERVNGNVQGFWYNNMYYNNIGTNEYVGSTSYSTAGIVAGNTNARDFSLPVYDVPNSVYLSTSPFVDITAGNFEPLAAYRQNGTMGAGYDLTNYPATDCFQNGRTYSSGTIIGLGAIQHANTAMFHGPGDIANSSTPAPAGDIFVDASATGNNDGTSWADAYNSLYDALNSMSLTPGGKVFVKAGTYYPTAGGFTVTDDSVQIFGGFDGTETDENDRDMSLIYTTNATIISGDVNGDDIVGDFSSNKADNLAQLMMVNTNSVTIDGFIFENAHKPSGSNPIIYFSVTGNTSYFTLKNSIIRNNYAASGLLMDYRYFTDTIEFINVAIKGNLVNNGICLFQSSSSNTPIDFNFVNFEFSDNQFNSDFGAIWFRETGTSNMNTTIVNSTFVNNTNDYSTSTIKHLVNISSLGSLENNVDVYNSIFYNNYYNSSIVSDNVFDNSKISEGIYGDLDIDNCIAPTIYPYTSNIDADAFNISTANPNLDAEYKPTSTSTAVIDQGTNSFYNSGLFGTLDASGNPRFVNTTIDLGAYEYNATLSSSSFSTNDFKLYPNPVTDFFTIDANEAIEKVEVYNLTGAKVMETNQTQVNISSLSAGLYLVKIYSENGVGVQKIIKK